MFPPRPTEDPREWLAGVGASLMRAAHHFNGQADSYLQDEGLRVKFFMGHAVPVRDRDLVRSYVKSFAKEAAWRAFSFKWFEDRLEFSVEPRRVAEDRARRRELEKTQKQ